MGKLPRCWRVTSHHDPLVGCRYIETLITYKRGIVENSRYIDNFTIRPATESDLKYIFRIIRLVRWHSRLFTDSRIYNESAYAIKEQYVRRNIAATYVVTHPSPKPMGIPIFVVGFMVIDNDKEAQEIGLIGVDPAWRRKGVGKRLILSLTGEVVMRTQQSNEACQKFLESLGFVEQYREDTYHSERLYENLDNRT